MISIMSALIRITISVLSGSSRTADLSEVSNPELTRLDVSSDSIQPSSQTAPALAWGLAFALSIKGPFSHSVKPDRQFAIVEVPTPSLVTTHNSFSGLAPDFCYCSHHSHPILPQHNRHQFAVSPPTARYARSLITLALGLRLGLRLPWLLASCFSFPSPRDPTSLPFLQLVWHV